MTLPSYPVRGEDLCSENSRVCFKEQAFFTVRGRKHLHNKQADDGEIKPPDAAINCSKERKEGEDVKA